MITLNCYTLLWWKCILQISNLWSGSCIFPGSFLFFIFNYYYYLWFCFLSSSFPQTLSQFREVHFMGWNSQQTLDRKKGRGGFDVKENYFYKCGNKSLSFNHVARVRVCGTESHTRLETRWDPHPPTWELQEVHWVSDWFSTLWCWRCSTLMRRVDSPREAALCSRVALGAVLCVVMLFCTLEMCSQFNLYLNCNVGLWRHF